MASVSSGDRDVQICLKPTTSSSATSSSVLIDNSNVVNEDSAATPPVSAPASSASVSINASSPCLVCSFIAYSTEMLRAYEHGETGTVDILDLM